MCLNIFCDAQIGFKLRKALEIKICYVRRTKKITNQNGTRMVLKEIFKHELQKFTQKLFLICCVPLFLSSLFLMDSVSTHIKKLTKDNFGAELSGSPLSHHLFLPVFAFHWHLCKLFTFSYGICSSSSTTVWAPMFLNNLCSCLRFFTMLVPYDTQRLLSLSRICW